MKVAVFLPDGAVMAGVQTRVLALAPGLEATGIQLQVYAGASQDSPVQRQFTAAGICFEGFVYKLHPPGRLGPLLLWLIRFPLILIRLIKRLRQDGCDGVHVNGISGLLPALAARLARKRLVMHWIGDHYPPWLVRCLSPWLGWICSDVILVSPGLAVYYRLKPQQYQVVPEPVLVGPSRFNDRAAFLRWLLGESTPLSGENEVWVVGIGYWVPAKDWVRFMDLANQIRSESSQYRFFLVGAPVTGHEALAEKIRLWGKREGCHSFFLDSIRNELRLFDLLLLTSRHEGTPLVILEALASRVPVLATPVGAISDMPGVGQGLSLFHSDHEALQGIRALSHSSMGASFCKPDLDLASHDLARCLEKHLAIYQKEFGRKSERSQQE